jgi:hypothetical protein
MKQYPQSYEKIAKYVPSAKSIADIGSHIGTKDEYAKQFRDFLKGLYLSFFDGLVKYVWLEHQYTYRGISRDKDLNSGFFPNKIFGYFMKNIVGISQKPFIDSFLFTAISSYIPDFFPKFYEHNPFFDPEYFKFPYKNISIDCLTFVYQCEERLDMLAYADKVSMSYGDFRDWAVNHVLCANPGEYEHTFWHNSTYIKRLKK